MKMPNDLAEVQKNKSSTGLAVKFGRPLDWQVIAGLSDIQKSTPNIMVIPKGKVMQ